MKKAFLQLVLSVIAGTLFAGNGIIVSQKYDSPDNKGASITVTWYVTNEQCKLKMDFKDEKVNSTTWFIPDESGARLLTYTEGPVPAGVQKMYFALPVQNIKPSGNDVSRVKVERTGETKTISGMVCEKMIVTTNRNITEMWVTKDFKPNFYRFFPFFQSMNALMGLSEEHIQGFPVSAVTKDISGKVISSYEVLSATSSELGATEFSVPAEYKSADSK